MGWPNGVLFRGITELDDSGWVNQTDASDELSVPAAPDCSKMACPKVCGCTESKCASQVSACLADETCARLQGCVQACKCGDHVCTLGCAMKHPTTKVMPLFQCTKANCWSKADMPAQTSVFEPLAALAAPAAPDC